MKWILLDNIITLHKKMIRATGRDDILIQSVSFPTGGTVGPLRRNY